LSLDLQFPSRPNLANDQKQIHPQVEVNQPKREPESATNTYRLMINDINAHAAHARHANDSFGDGFPQAGEKFNPIDNVYLFWPSTVLESECVRLARTRSRQDRTAKRTVFAFSRKRITASRPDFHHFVGHNPMTSQPAVNAALANFATLRIVWALWRETIRAAAPDPELGGRYRQETTDGRQSRCAPISKSRHDSSDLCITTSPASRPHLARQLCEMLAPLLEISNSRI